jgi:hypothetical protein
MEEKNDTEEYERQKGGSEGGQYYTNCKEKMG